MSIQDANRYKENASVDHYPKCNNFKRVSLSTVLQSISTSDRVSQLLQYSRIRRTIPYSRIPLEQLRGKSEKKLLDDNEDDIRSLPLIRPSRWISVVLE